MAEPGSKVSVLGKPLSCLVCGHDEFARRSIKMQTTGLTFFDLDWLNKDADGAICTACGFLHQFASNAQQWGGSLD